MVGDSWAADVIGACDAGIRAIWFNPLGKPAPDPSAAVEQIRRLDPPTRRSASSSRSGTPCGVRVPPRE